MTDTVKHTPSPWQIDRKGLIIKSIGPCIPDEYAGSAWLEVSEADARLISAAPELLRVAELLVSWLDEEEGAHKLCDAARAAIAKAEGRS